MRNDLMATKLTENDLMIVEIALVYMPRYLFNRNLSVL